MTNYRVMADRSEGKSRFCSRTSMCCLGIYRSLLPCWRFSIVVSSLLFFFLVASLSEEGRLYLWHPQHPSNLWCQSPCGLWYMIAWFLQDRTASAKRKLHSWPHVIFSISSCFRYFCLFVFTFIIIVLCSSSYYVFLLLLFFSVASLSGEGGLYLWHPQNPLNLWCQSPCGLWYMIAWFLQDRKASAKRKLHSWPHVIVLNISLRSVGLFIWYFI